MSFSPNKNEKPEKNGISVLKWLPPVLWVMALACVGFMGIVIAQRTPIIRGSNEKTETGLISCVGRRILYH